ncbi:MAG: ribose-phosphate diphosphokinase [Longimonas sp.]|uniref:ribose-phosphate diphosphokinase n=1 Tax=Longimonas sp. TaxID=2039626 RepID=UPI00335B7FA6
MPTPRVGCAAFPTDLPFARQVATARDWPCIQADVTRFPDDEIDVQWPAPLPQTVVLVTSLVSTHDQSVHDRIMELVFGLHQLKEAGVARCIGLVPYLGYTRSDTKATPTNLLGLKAIARHLTYAGLDALLTVDAHTPAALHNAFSGPTWSMNPVSVMAEQVDHQLPEGAKVAVCAPDAGAWKRAQAWAQALATPQRGPVELALVHKQRIRPDTVTQNAFMGDVTGRTVLVVDDMISTGGTMAQAVQTCYDAGAQSVWAAVTHGLLLDSAPTRLRTAGLERLFVANTIPADQVTSTPLHSRTHTVDVAPRCAQDLTAVMTREAFARPSP